MEIDQLIITKVPNAKSLDQAQAITEPVVPFTVSFVHGGDIVADRS